MERPEPAAYEGEGRNVRVLAGDACQGSRPGWEQATEAAATEPTGDDVVRGYPPALSSAESSHAQVPRARGGRGVGERL